jgi:hypothetical protein
MDFSNPEILYVKNERAVIEIISFLVKAHTQKKI